MLKSRNRTKKYCIIPNLFALPMQIMCLLLLSTCQFSIETPKKFFGISAQSDGPSCRGSIAGGKGTVNTCSK